MFNFNANGKLYLKCMLLCFFGYMYDCVLVVTHQPRGQLFFHKCNKRIDYFFIPKILLPSIPLALQGIQLCPTMLLSSFNITSGTWLLHKTRHWRFNTFILMDQKFMSYFTEEFNFYLLIQSLQKIHHCYGKHPKPFQEVLSYRICPVRSAGKLIKGRFWNPNLSGLKKNYVKNLSTCMLKKSLHSTLLQTLF